MGIKVISHSEYISCFVAYVVIYHKETFILFFTQAKTSPLPLSICVSSIDSCCRAVLVVLCICTSKNNEPGTYEGIYGNQKHPEIDAEKPPLTVYPRTKQAPFGKTGARTNRVLKK